MTVAEGLGEESPGKRLLQCYSRRQHLLPKAISVNMFKWRLMRDCQPRTKKGKPPQRTTGEARAN